MTSLLNDLIFISQSGNELPIWPLLAASLLAAISILRRRRSD